MLLAMVAGIVITGLGAGGVVYYLSRSGRIPMERGIAQKSEAHVPVSTHSMVLDPLLVNLADAGGSSYLRVSLTLRIAVEADKKGAKAKDEKGKDDKGSDDAVAEVRDTVLTVLGRQTADGLLATDGKDDGGNGVVHTQYRGCESHRLGAYAKDFKSAMDDANRGASFLGDAGAVAHIDTGGSGSDRLHGEAPACDEGGAGV
jgi:flagellar basal body-associated protein FliL